MTQLYARLFGYEFANMTTEDFEFNHTVIEHVLEWHEVDGWWFNSDDQRTCDIRVLDPKNRIAHAWYLVERLAECGWTTYTTTWPDGRKTACCMKWTEESYGSSLTSMTDQMEAATMSHAICLAALGLKEAHQCASES